MCFGGSKPPPPPMQIIPPTPTMPVRGSEENMAGVNAQLNAMRARGGFDSTRLTGGLGDAGYDQSTRMIPRQTKLGGRE